MGLRVDPGGGGQFAGAISKIIEAEGQPIRSLEGRKAKQEARLKLFQEFRGKVTAMDKLLADMSTFHKFRELKADLGDGENLISVTLDKDRAETGRYDIEIDELAQRSSSVSNGFADPDEPILGMGFITMELATGDSAEIFIDDKSSSLRGIASLINRKQNSKVQASVVKDVSDTSAPWKLLITAKKDGLSNQIDYPQFYFLDGAADFFIDDDRDASNAQILIDGFPFEIESNDVTDFLPGVNIHMKQARPDQPFTLNITEDYSKITQKVKGLVDQVNQILQFIYKQNAIDQNSDTSTTFAGDSTLQGLEYIIRNIFHEGYLAHPEEDEETLVYMSHIGIAFEKNGLIAMNTEKFQKNLEADFGKIAEAFTSPDGLISSLRELVGTYTGSGQSFLGVKEQGLHDKIKELDRQIDTKNRFLDRKKQDLVSQFARLEGSLANMQKQQQYLTATMPAGGGLNSLIGG
ncbi:MAG: flagellar filament capping protein FliD [Bdellovibrio sp.]|nr:flagellar filament capping protein FliD [Bdellovibrio sp.]